jgi:hypothetical protein
MIYGIQSKSHQVLHHREQRILRPLSSVSKKRNQHNNASHSSRHFIRCTVRPAPKWTRTNTSTTSPHRVYSWRDSSCLSSGSYQRILFPSQSIERIEPSIQISFIRSHLSGHTCPVRSGEEASQQSTLQASSLFVFVVWLILLCFDLILSLALIIWSSVWDLRFCWINEIIIIIIVLTNCSTTAETISMFLNFLKPQNNLMVRVEAKSTFHHPKSVRK